MATQKTPATYTMHDGTSAPLLKGKHYRGFYNRPTDGKPTPEDNAMCLYWDGNKWLADVGGDAVEVKFDYFIEQE